jgi:predicted dehydrogenase
MNQAEKDAEQWYRTHAHREARRLIEAKELGKPYYIDRGGYVITPVQPQKNPDKKTTD